MDIKSCSKELIENGVVVLRSFYNDHEMSMIKKAINSAVDKPSPFKSFTENSNGSFYMDFANWRRVKELETACKYKKTVDTLKELVGSEKCWLFHDHILIKSGEAPPTPWHHDRPYYIFKGNMNLSIWTPLEDVPKETGMVFLKGSHLSSDMYMPRSFKDGSEIEGEGEFKILDDAVLDLYEKLEFDLERGDALVFLNNTIHSAHAHKKNFERSSLSIRYLMDGASLTNNYINATPPFDRMGVKVVEDQVVPEKFFPELS